MSSVTDLESLRAEAEKRLGAARLRLRIAELGKSEADHMHDRAALIRNVEYRDALEEELRRLPSLGPVDLKDALARLNGVWFKVAR